MWTQAAGPGVYVLHFERPTGYGRAPGQAENYGDDQHYVGQTSNIAKRLKKHRNGWNGRAQGAAFVRFAGQAGINYRLAYVAIEPDELRRLQLEKLIQQDPSASCTECSGAGIPPGALPGGASSGDLLPELPGVDDTDRTAPGG